MTLREHPAASTDGWRATAAAAWRMRDMIVWRIRSLDVYVLTFYATHVSATLWRIRNDVNIENNLDSKTSISQHYVFVGFIAELFTDVIILRNDVTFENANSPFHQCYKFSGCSQVSSSQLVADRNTIELWKAVMRATVALPSTT